ncbi:MAG: hypothetical protein HYR85_13135 [Planctomycetes bacterium]|nr:hypothetical protein [Planctomycetota bacterium]
MDKTRGRRIRFLVWYVLAWTVAALYFFSQSLSQKFHFNDPTPWWHSRFSWLTGMYPNALGTSPSRSFSSPWKP